MLITIHTDDPEKRKIDQIVEILMEVDGIAVIPTGTIYGFMTRPGNRKGIERITRIKEISKNQHLELVCQNITTISKYARHVSNSCFKLIKRTTPGPYTFIFQASKEIPKIFLTKKGFIGVRIPDNKIIQAILEKINSPLISTSAYFMDKWYTDPKEIHDEMGDLVDVVIDGGTFPMIPTTIIDCSTGIAEITREGKGKIDIL